ncbi:Aminoacyl-tRNA editing domain protein [uncultured archaeon]|nr:Aminoacyl-tRNA editing domain protein [uncultured archaeon]
MLDDFIKVNRLSATIFPCDDAHTAAKAMKFTGDEEAVAKSIVLIDSNQSPLLVIMLGKDRADFAKIKKILGVADVRLCQPKEVIEITGYEIGGVPPISIYGIKTIMDKAVSEKDEVVCGGGDPRHLMKIKVLEIMECVEDISLEDIRK